MCSSPYCTHSWVIDDRATTTLAGRQYLSPTYGDNSITVTNAAVTNGVNTWVQWNTASTAITIDASRVVWGEWVQSAYVDALGRPLRRRVQRAEAARADDEAAQESRRRAETARERAEELLDSCLNAEQRDQLFALGRFCVTAPSGRVYWIEQGYAGNVYSDGLRFCIHMDARLPAADHMLAQMLMIQTDEEAFLKTANASVAAGYPAQVLAA